MKDLLILDMNGVLVKETLGYEIARKYRTESISLFKKYSQGLLSAKDLVIQAGFQQKGISQDILEKEAPLIYPVKNAKEFIEKLNDKFHIYIISSDYEILARRIAGMINIEEDHVFANRPIYHNDLLSGIFYEPIIADDEKANIAHMLKNKHNANRLISIGDDNTNIALFNVSDLAIAYNATPMLKEVADICIDSDDILDLIQYLF